MPSRSERVAEVRSAAAGLLIGALLSGLLAVPLVNPTPAFAITCGFQEGWAGHSKPVADTHFGAKAANQDVSSTSDDCINVRSSYVSEDTYDFVEVGSYMDPQGDLPPPCDAASTPHYLAYAFVAGGTDCLHPSDHLGDGNHSFSVKNPNHDTHFDYYLDGNPTGTYNTNMNTGTVTAASERHKGSDSLKASFNGLAWFGAGGTWSDYGDVQRDKVGSFNDFSFCPTGPNSFDVKANC